MLNHRNFYIPGPPAPLLQPRTFSPPCRNLWRVSHHHTGHFGEKGCLYKARFFFPLTLRAGTHTKHADPIDAGHMCSPARILHARTRGRRGGIARERQIYERSRDGNVYTRARHGGPTSLFSTDGRRPTLVGAKKEERKENVTKNSGHRARNRQLTAAL